MIGKKFGQWIIIERKENSKQGQKRWLCECECNEKRIFTTSYLNTGQATCCRKCREKYKKEIEKSIIEKYLNKKIGDFIVVKYLGKNKYKSRQWLCKCKCGNERVFRTSMLSGNGIIKATLCKECYNESFEFSNRINNYIPNRFWYKFLNSTKRRKINIEITKKYIYNLYKKQNKKCALTGTDLYFTKLTTNFNRYTNASLDRIDNSKGYIKGNLQWLEKRVNMMKQQYSQNEFVEVCKLVAKNY